MQPRPARPPHADKTNLADRLSAIGPRDSSDLAMALDEYAPSDAVQEDILRRVLLSITTDDPRTAPSVTHPSGGQTHRWLTP